MTQRANISISIEEEKVTKLKTIINDLFESGSINSNEMEDFIKFTLFIVFDEYEKNISSLKKFYSMNLTKYLEYKKPWPQTGSK
jgi:ADP-glucose pyrophosphorylase